MPSPTLGSVQTALPLQQISIGYTNAEYTMANAFPVIAVGARTGKYYVFPKAEAFADEALVVSAGLSASRGTRSISEDTFTLDKLAHEEEVYDDIVDEALRNNSNPALEYLQATEAVTDRVLLKRERIITTMITDTSWTGSAVLAAGSEWNSAGGGDPVAVLNTAHMEVYDTIYRPANTWITDWKTSFILQFHPLIRDLVKYTQAGPVPMAQIAGFYGINRVFVSMAGYNTSGKNLTASLASVLGDYFWLGYVSPVAARRVPSAAYLFELNGAQGRKVETYREEKEYRDVVRCTSYFAAKATSVDAGYLISNTQA